MLRGSFGVCCSRLGRNDELASPQVTDCQPRTRPSADGLREPHPSQQSWPVRLLSAFCATRSPLPVSTALTVSSCGQPAKPARGCGLQQRGLALRTSRKRMIATGGKRSVCGGQRRLAVDHSGRRPEHSESGSKAVVRLYVRHRWPVAVLTTAAPAPVARPIAAGSLHRRSAPRTARRRAAQCRPARRLPNAAAPTCSACRSGWTVG